MLKLKELRFSGIGRFVEEQVVNFEALGNLIQVDGQNLNTGGSSGAGKSTIFHALDYLFGVNHIPNTVLKSRLSDSGISVQGTFDLDGKPLTISRGKKLKIDLDGEVTTGSSKITEEKLDQLISIPRDLFRPMMHKRQKEGGFFLKMTPKDINDFLMNCLGLGHFKGKIDIIDKKAKDLAEKSVSVASSLEAAKSAFSATQTAIVALGPGPAKDMDRPTILALKTKAEKSAQEWAVIASKHRIELETLELQRPQITSVPFDRSHLEGLEKTLSDLDNQINQLKTREKDRQNDAKLELSQLQNKITKLNNAIAKGELAVKQAETTAEQIKKIRAGSCYVCGNTWHDKKTEEKLVQSLSTYKQEIMLGQQAQLELPSVILRTEALNLEVVPQEIRGLAAMMENRVHLEPFIIANRQKERDHQAAETAKNREAQSQFSTLQSQLREKQLVESEQFRGQADLDRRALEMAVGRLKAYEEALRRHETSLASLKAQETAYSTKASDLTLLLSQIQDELAMAEELKRAMKSYLSCSFDDALETIGDNATKLIRNIPTMATSTVQLEGIRETKDGKLKEEVNAVIHMDGEEAIPIASLSGGERSALDLAIDLAVLDLIADRSSQGIMDILILDEPFGGLDLPGIEMVLEMLKNANLNKKLIIVDHNDAVKEMVDSRIIVTREGITSRIEQ